MTIILFHGLGCSKKNFKWLERIDTVFIPEIPYTNLYYYSENKTMKTMYEPIDKKIYKAPYIVIGHSHGIYYAYEFAK